MTRIECISDLLVFVHVAKTAGTSVIDAIESNMRDGRRMLWINGDDVPSDRCSLESFRAMTQENLLPFGAIAGHVSIREFSARLVGRRAKFVTVVRDPIDRLHSLFRMIERMSYHPLRQSIPDWSLHPGDFEFFMRTLLNARHPILHEMQIQLTGTRSGTVDWMSILRTSYELVVDTGHVNVLGSMLPYLTAGSREAGPEVPRLNVGDVAKAHWSLPESMVRDLKREMANEYAIYQYGCEEGERAMRSMQTW